MLIESIKNETSHFLPQSDFHFIPGYTGYCPTLKFQFGKCYGACTKEILQTLSRNEIFHQSPKIANYSSCNENYKENCNFSNGKYILGYTGYIPGMCRCYGNSFHESAEKCETDEKLRTVSFEKKLGSLNHSIIKNKF